MLEPASSAQQADEMSNLEVQGRRAGKCHVSNVPFEPLGVLEDLVRHGRVHLPDAPGPGWSALVEPASRLSGVRPGDNVVKPPGGAASSVRRK
jgi:hypothetical protein